MQWRAPPVAGLAVALAALFAGTPGQSAEPTIEQACSRLLISYAWATDSNDLEGIVGAYAPDAVLENARARVAGRGAIEHYFRDRVAERRASGFGTRHILSNIAITRINRRYATGTAYETVYRFPVAGPHPAGSLEPILVGTLTARFVISGGQCRFLLRKADEVLRDG